MRTDLKKKAYAAPQIAEDVLALCECVLNTSSGLGTEPVGDDVIIDF